ncbi:MAG: hypothetical protein FJ102_11815 [Deltaproteobacteria bacterium]|nr:hypothetical protein [Deltaproteobacteria bacterium]
MTARFLPLALLALLASPAEATTSTAVAEQLSTSQMVPPAVIFVIDLSANMSSSCFSGSTNTCLADTVDVVKQVSQHFTDVRYGVVGTAENDSDFSYIEIVPVGTSYADMATALDALTAWSTDTRNLSEVVELVSSDYLEQSTAEDWSDDDGDGYDGDWGETPFQYYCSSVHMIVLSSGRAVYDDQGTMSSFSAAPPSDVICDAAGDTSGGSTGSDVECHYDNLVTHVYNYDHSSLSDTQRMTVSTIGLGLDTSDTYGEATADLVFQSAADATGGDGMYTNASTKDEAMSGVLAVLADLLSGIYSRSSPVMANNGSYLIYTYYELTGDHPLAEGHVLAYEIDDDPESSTYGELIYYSGAPYDDYYGAQWDAGWKLYSRVADAAESNDDDLDGFSHRDIFFYDTSLETYMLADAAEKRMGFDKEFVDAVVLSGTLSNVMDDSVDTNGALTNDAYDLTDDGLVLSDDLQDLVDFTRGVYTTQFRYIDLEHGRWKLGDSPYSSPAIVTKRNDVFSNSDTYRNFLALVEAETMPDIVLVSANDGMLHAFALEDDDTTPTSDEAGEELWAWIPNSLILRDRGAEWAGGLIDMMWYGRTFLFDGTPVVKDVWIDLDGDNKKECGTDLDDCEWRRVVVVQQGLGGTRTLALDITYTDSPTFLWEQTNSADSTAMGYTTSRPAVFNVYDRSGTTSRDRWVAMWGSGRPADYSSSSTDYFDSVEGSLYMWDLGEDAFSGGATGAGYSVSGDNIEASEHPDSTYASSLDLDGDGKLEYTYISAPPAVVDHDSDGDADVAYFPLTLSYDPSSGPGSSVAQGHTWIYKALINSSDPSDLEWCEFYDPYDGAVNENDSGSGSAVPYGSRPEVFYAITTAWLKTGELGLYWGTGSPFLSSSSSDPGAFFLMKDPDPTTCSSSAVAMTCGSETGGFYQLEAGERLTDDPIVYAGSVYFPTYTPSSDTCEIGTGRLYALDVLDCTPGMDTDGDGTASSADTAYVEMDGYMSSPSIGLNGKLYYSGATDVDIQVVNAVDDPFHGTATVAWMEQY